MKYPDVMSEDATLAFCASRSIARFGDGELRCMLGGGCTSQKADDNMSKELQTILSKPRAALVAIPNYESKTPKRESWARYAQDKFVSHYAKGYEFGSSFITRPDNAPWIDRPDYWQKVCNLWNERNVTLVVGDKKSITTELLRQTATSVREIIGPSKHAYASLPDIEDQVGVTNDLILICLGTAATVLAYRLANKGMHALDLGHIGMFMRHAGAYKYISKDLISESYRLQIERLHASRRWGADGAKHVDAVDQYRQELDAITTLDYGCGEGKLAEAMAKRGVRVSGYDPGIPERAGMPKPCELVVCTDVLEHIEPDYVPKVLDHIHRLTGKGAYFVIHLGLANAVLPDGRNAHLSIYPATQWLLLLQSAGFEILRYTQNEKELRVWAKRSA